VLNRGSVIIPPLMQDPETGGICSNQRAFDARLKSDESGPAP
jgi:hypothetical protein